VKRAVSVKESLSCTPFFPFEKYPTEIPRKEKKEFFECKRHTPYILLEMHETIE
jgi:hypothetical protein